MLGKDERGAAAAAATRMLNSDTTQSYPKSKYKSDVYYGVGSCRPSCLQLCCTNIKAFSVVFALNSLIVASLAVYLVSQITSIEKQFGFSSTQSGLMMSCNDIGYLFTILLFSYYGQKYHIPRILCFSTILYGISGILCSIPYYISPAVGVIEIGNSTPSSVPFCDHNARERNTSTFITNSYNSLGTKDQSIRTAALVILGIGMALQGCGKAPRFPLASTYIDDNINKTKTGLFMGLIFGITIFGPVLAFGLGALFSSTYVNLKSTTLTPKDPQWIGAWWLGFLTFGFTSLIIAIPLFFFPKRMSSSRGQGGGDKNQQQQRISFELFKIIYRLLKNPIFIIIIFYNSIKVFVTAGTLPFLPKYLETQFLIPSWKANILFGTSVILMACVGIVLGGLLTYRYQMTAQKCIKFSIYFTAISVAVQCLGFVFGCPQPHIQKGEMTTNVSSVMVQTDRCTDGCQCHDYQFFPVCGSNKVNYYSPCHAGCTNDRLTNCLCIPDPIQTVTPGYCNTECKYLGPFLIKLLGNALTDTIVMIPNFLIIIRCVLEKDKTVAMGTIALATSLLGWMPAPIAFGKLVDFVCIRWDTRGACILYDNVYFRIMLHVAFIIASVLVLLLHVCLLYLGKNHKWSEKKVEETFYPIRDGEKLVNFKEKLLLK